MAAPIARSRRLYSHAEQSMPLVPIFALTFASAAVRSPRMFHPMARFADSERRKVSLRWKDRWRLLRGKLVSLRRSFAAAILFRKGKPRPQVKSFGNQSKWTI